MKKTMKYIMFDNKGTRCPVIFSAIEYHRDIKLRFPDMVPLSAGFIDIRDNRFVCHGESQSLDLKSHPRDTATMNNYMGVQ